MAKYGFRDFGAVAATTLRLLTFRSIRPDPQLQPLYIACGLAFAWLAGIGRYWDNPRAELWQPLGLGSVAYVFVMAAILWVIMLPLRPRSWTYQTVLIFVALTSPPAFLYAIPVERFLPFHEAQAANMWFLAVVAAWRVILLWLFLRRAAGLSDGEVFVGTFLPIALIISTLTFLNLEKAVFDFMGGLAPGSETSSDGAFGILIALTTISFLALPFLAVAYLVLIYKRAP